LSFALFFIIIIIEDPPDEGDEIFIIDPITTSMAVHLQKGPDGPGVAWTTPRAEWLLEYENNENAMNFMFEVFYNLILDQKRYENNE
jgi:hypothetical protein